jgi:hypothetical protein
VRKWASKELKAYALAEYSKGRTTRDVAKEIGYHWMVVDVWRKKAGIRFHPRIYKINFAPPATSDWTFVKDVGIDETKHHVAEYKCMALLPTGSRCGHQEILRIHRVTLGISLRCRGCTMRACQLSRRKPFDAHCLEWRKQRGGYVTKEDRAYTMLCTARDSDATTKQKLGFDLDLDFLKGLLEPDRCSVTQIRFDHTRPRITRRANMYVPSLDRIDPKKGYQKANVRVVVWIYNRLKSYHSEAEIAGFIKMAYEGTYGNAPLPNRLRIGEVDAAESLEKG